VRYVEPAIPTGDLHEAVDMSGQLIKGSKSGSTNVFELKISALARLR
jgi:hypothetical protein